MRTQGVRPDQGNNPQLGASTISVLTCLALLFQAVASPSLQAAQEPITETLLQQPSGAPTAGRLWPGFAAAQGLDTGAEADPNGVKPEQIDTGATADPSGPAPEPLRTDLSPGGIPSGGDLSSPTVPWMGSGAVAPTDAATEPLTGGAPTSGGIGLGGGSPLGAGASLPNFGNLAAGMFGQTMTGVPGMPGLTSIPGVPNVPGLQGLGNTMGLFGMLSILNSLPQMIAQLPKFVTQLPKMLLDSLQSIGQMFLSLFQLPQMIWQSFSGMGEGLMGGAGRFGQSVQPPANGVEGGVAGSVPSQPGGGQTREGWPDYLQNAAKYKGVCENGNSNTDGGGWVDKFNAFNGQKGVAWCANFMNYTLNQSGIQGTGSAMAQSFAGWGSDAGGPQVGSVGVIDRGGGYGHVGYVVGVTPEGNVLMLGGNQGGCVKVGSYKRGSFMAFRWPPGRAGAGGAAPVMDAGGLPPAGSESTR